MKTMKVNAKNILLISTGVILLFIAACSSNEQRKKPGLNEKEKALLESVKPMVQQSAKALQGVLKTALADSGAVKAIAFCNVEANGILDPINGKNEGRSISRVSHKPRNPENRGVGLDKMALSMFNKKIEQGAEIKPILVPDLESKKYRAYFPIMIQAMCKTCHGIVEHEISEDVYQAILEKYPEDEAVNFFDGTLRGAWKVVIDVDPYSLRDYPAL